MYTALAACMLLFFSGSVYAVNFTDPIDTAKSKSASKNRITDTRKDKPSTLKSGVKVNIVPFKPGVKPASAASRKPVEAADDKVLSDVKIYPNPVSDQLNISYNVGKESNVTIKIMDVLGNEIATLLASQRMQPGDQSNSFSIASKLNSGFYFIRIIVGNETVVKRISVL